MADRKSQTLYELGFAIGDKIQFIDDVRPRTIDEVNLHYRPILPFKTISKASETNMTWKQFKIKQLNERFEFAKKAVDQHGSILAAARELECDRQQIQREFRRGKL